MANDFFMKIGDISEVFDGPHATPKKIDIGPYFLSISSLDQGQLDLSKSAHLSEEQFIKWTKRVTPQEGDVLFSYETRLGEAALMPAGVTACLGRRMALLRPDRSKILPEYLLYAYLSPAFQQEIKKRTIHGATVERIALRELPDFNILVLTIEEQEKVVANLNVINGKIRLNKQTNQTIEQMAQTLFKSWFVDFDPVFDNLLAKVDFDLTKLPNDFPAVLLKRAQKRLLARNTAGSSASPSITPKTMPATMTANQATKKTEHNTHHQHFPSEFEFNEQLGWIPKGWECKQLEDLVEIASSKRVFAKDYVESGVPFYRGKEITELSQGNEVKTEIFITEDKYQELKLKAGSPKAGDILITSVGTIGNAHLVGQEDKFYFKDGNLTWVKEYKGLSIAHFLIEWLKNPLGKNAIENIKIGTTQQAITIKSLNKIKLIVPTNNVSELFEAYAEKYHDKLVSNNNQNSSLIRLRDTLLPKLISGKLQIPDAVKLSGDVKNHV